MLELFLSLSRLICLIHDTAFCFFSLLGCWFDRLTSVLSLHSVGYGEKQGILSFLPLHTYLPGFLARTWNGLNAEIALLSYTPV